MFFYGNPFDEPWTQKGITYWYRYIVYVYIYVALYSMILFHQQDKTVVWVIEGWILPSYILELFYIRHLFKANLVDHHQLFSR